MADALGFSVKTSFCSAVSIAKSSLAFFSNQRFQKRVVFVVDSSRAPIDFVSRISFRTAKKVPSFKVHATIDQTEAPKWWEKNAGPNMIDIHSTKEFLDALSQAGDRLVIVEFYGTWCASCRALFPKLCRTAMEHPEILFLKVNFDENKPMCKSLNVKVLPYFHFYRGADGQLESFSCSLAKLRDITCAYTLNFHRNLMLGLSAGEKKLVDIPLTARTHLVEGLKFQKIKDAIELHNTARCSIGPPRGLGDIKLETLLAAKDVPAGSSSSS